MSKFYRQGLRWYIRGKKVFERKFGIFGKFGSLEICQKDYTGSGEGVTVVMRTFTNLGEGIFRLVGCSGVLVPVGIKVRAKTQPTTPDSI